MDNDTLIRGILPAGEWADVKVVPAAGMMARWAVFATATWLRRGGVEAFVKFIHSAKPGAGVSTVIVTAHERLDRLERRLALMKGSHALPLVPILDLRMILDKGLLIAMERVTPLQDLIDSGKAGPAVASRVLRSLDITPHSSWHHFDICPRNIGVRADGTPVFIDIESFYMSNGDDFAVTVPAFKDFRLPGSLRSTILNHLRPGGNEIQLPRKIAAEKYKFEVILAAAEAAIGSVPHISDYSSEEWFARWPASTHTQFFHAAFRALLQDPARVSLADLADRLTGAPAAAFAAPIIGAPALFAPANPVVSAIPVVATIPVVAARPAILQMSPEEWRVEFEGLRSEARALRQGDMSGPGITKYQHQLAALVAKHPNARAIWEERLALAVSFQRDPDGARAVVEAALSAMPNDAGFERWRNILSAWKSE
jgi:hypothetical protein